MKHTLVAAAFGLLAAAGAHAATGDFTTIPDGDYFAPITLLGGTPDAMTLSHPGGFIVDFGTLYTYDFQQLPDLSFPITIDFATPVRRVSIVGGIDDFGWFEGVLEISGVAFPVGGGGPTVMDYVPAAPASSLTIVITEVEGSSAAGGGFLAIESITTTPVPLPAPAALLLGALALGAAAARRGR